MLSSTTVSALPWLAAAWIVTVVVAAVLIYLIARAVLGKTDSQNLAEVLRALTPLLNVLVRALFRLPADSGTNPESHSGQTGHTSSASTKEAS